MRRIPIVILITALCTGLFLVFSTCHDNPPDQKYEKQLLKESAEKINSIHAHYQTQLAHMKRGVDSLSKALSKAEKQLIATQIQLKQKQQRVLKLVESDTSELAVKEKLNNCDSLKLEVKEYVVWVDSTQLHYEKVIKELHQLIALKDSELVVCRVSYTDINQLATDNIERERRLTEALNTAYKSQKRKQLQSKVWMASFLILSGITASFLINTK